MPLSTSQDTPVRHRPPAQEGLPPVAVLPRLQKGERVAHWVKAHLGQLERWNSQGWRWAQIATAVGDHIDREVTRNKLTGMVTMIRKGKLAVKIDPVETALR